MTLATGPDADVGQETKGWKFAVASGILGWVLDAFDFFVVVFLFDTLANHFHVSKVSVVYTLTLTLAMRPLGALFFGALADRFGRKRPLIFCVLYFSIDHGTDRPLAKLSLSLSLPCVIWHRPGRILGCRRIVCHGEFSAPV